MSSDDYDPPRVASLEDLRRRPNQTKNEKESSEDESEPRHHSKSLLEPLQQFLHHERKEIEEDARVQMRDKKGFRPQETTMSHCLDEDSTEKFKRKSVERHSMLAGEADFERRRISKLYGSGKWTDLFSSNRFKRKQGRKKIFNGPSTSSADDYSGSVAGLSIASNCSSESISLPRTEEELRLQFRSIMLEKNVPSSKIDQLVASTPTEQMQTMVLNAQRTDFTAKQKQPPECSIQVLLNILKAENVLDRKQDIVTVRIQLQCQSVTFLYEFAEKARDANGNTGFELICKLYELIIKRLRCADVGSKYEIDLIDFLQEIVRCIRTIVNTYKGLELVLKRDSPVCSLLIRTLLCLNRRNPNDAEPAEVRALRIDVATICSSLMIVSHDTTTKCQLEMTGQQKMFTELTSLARNGSSKRSRFWPLVQCLDFFGERDSSQTTRVLLMLNMLINGVDRNTMDDHQWTEETIWQMRMRLRTEAAKDGLSKKIETFSADNVDKRVREVANNMISEQNEDFETLVGKHESLKIEYDSLDGCFEFLAASSEASGVENVLLSIMQLLSLVPEEMSTKRAYLKLIETCVTEIVLNRTPFDPEAQERFVFETPISEILEQMQDEEMAKKLRQATAAKQEAVTLQGEYWKAIEELQKETEALRKHIADPKSNPLPSPTKIAPSAPSMSLPPITGGPPPPPPPGGIAPVTGGPPPPPPPPPPPGGIGGLPPVKGGPPPPPPPPPPGGRIPPPPPPGGKGPPPPPALGFGVPIAPPIPEYLQPKKVRKVDVPMRKLPWGSNTIHPKDIPKQSFWVDTHEEAITNDIMFERLKTKFSTKSAATPASSKCDMTNTKKKIKVPQVIHDDKLLQRLGILQGSVKMSHSELKNAILEVNEKVLTSGLLEQLRDAFPSVDVLAKLKQVSRAQFEEMPEGEQFATKLAQINALPLRLDLIGFKMRFVETLDELKQSMSSVMEACEEIRKSEGLRIFLQLILAFGNFMGGSAKNYSNIYAFEMRLLTKLIDTKDNENKHTLLHHLIEEMRRLNPRHVRFAITDFHHCVESSRINAEELSKATRLVKSNIEKLENCLKTYQSQGERDRFVEKMRPFLERAKKEFTTVKSLSEKMENDWKILADYYAFDTKKYQMEDFFGDICTFSDQYKSAWNELEAEAEAANAEAKRREKSASNQQRRQPLGEKNQSGLPSTRVAPRTPAAMIKVSTAVDKAGVFDELERATGNEVFLQTLMSATNSRTPRIGGYARSRPGRAVLERQRSRVMEKAMAGELKVRVRRNGAPAVPIEQLTNSTSRTTQISPTHKENREPPTDDTTNNTVTQMIRQKSEANSVPSTEDLLARLKQF